MKVWKTGDDEMVVRACTISSHQGCLADDPDPLAMHHMVLDLTISFPGSVITSASLAFEVHPHTECPQIAQRYEQLVGLSMARGFTHKVRELFGSPRGCTHSTALLQAMAPAVVQSTWSIRAKTVQSQPVEMRQAPTPEERERMFAFNLNTCHIWAEDGEHIAAVRHGEMPEVPLQIAQRFRNLGRDPDEWSPSGA